MASTTTTLPADKTKYTNTDTIIRQTDCQYRFGKEAASITIKYLGVTSDVTSLASNFREGTRVKLADLKSKFTELSVLNTDALEASGKVTSCQATTKTGSAQVNISISIPYKGKISTGSGGGGDDDGPEARIVVTWTEKSTDYEFPLEVYAGEGQSASEVNAGNLESWKQMKTKDIALYKAFKFQNEGDKEPTELEGRTKELAKKIYKGVESVRRAYPEAIRTTRYFNYKAKLDTVDDDLIKQIQENPNLYYRDQTPDPIWKSKFKDFDWLKASYDVDTETTEYDKVWNMTVTESWIGIDKKDRGTWDDDLYGSDRWPFADVTGKPSPSPEEDPSTPTTDIEWNDGTTQQTESLRGRIKSTSISDIQSVSRVDFGNQVYAIDDGTFSGCTKLRQVTMPEVSHIGTSAFEGTTLLPMVELSEKVTSMGTSAFKNSGLMSATINPSVYELPADTFNSCSNLSVPAGSDTLQVAGSVKEVGDRAFQGCSSLQGISFTNKVSSIGEEAFDGCFDLAVVRVPEDATGTLTLGDSSFKYCTKLQEITLPVQTINAGTDVFAYYTFSEITGPVKVKAPKSLLASIPSPVTYDYEYPSFVTSIARAEWQGDTRLKGITVPESVTSLGHNLCINCTALKTAIFKPSVTNSGTSTFGQCSSLTDLEIGGDTLTTLELNFAKDCTSLVNLTITAPLTTLGDSSSINNGVFRGCSALTSIDLPDTLTTIGAWAFARTSNLSEVTLPQGLTTINRNAFQESGIESITIPSTVTSFQEQVFMSCAKLKTVVFEPGVTSIGYQAFKDCTALATVLVPSSVATIGATAFENTGSSETPPEITMDGKDMATVQAMTDYPWGLRTGSTVHCSDGDITI